MARRSPGEGALFYSEALDRWVGLLDASDASGRRRRHKVTAKTKTETRQKLEVLRRRRGDGLPVGDGRLTVGAFLEEWLRTTLPARGLSQNTIDNYGWAITRYLEPAFGRKLLRDLSPDDVDNLLRTCAARGMSRNSIDRIRSVLRMALRHAERRGYVARNVARLVDTPAAPVGARRSLTVVQARSLLDAARGDRLEALYVTGLMMGLRPGELLGLTWPNIDLSAGRLTVAQSLKRERTGLRLGDPKAASFRCLDMPAPVIAALRAHKVKQAAERLAAGRAWAEIGLVFATELGTPIDPSNLRRSFARITTTAGLGKWHPHELRHSATSILSASGLRLEEVADVLGHRDMRTTSRVYRHAIDESIPGAAAPMERLFGSTGTEDVAN